MNPLKNNSNLESKSQEDLVLSEKPLKIGVVHYFWDSSSRGVNTVVRNSVVKGLGTLYPNSKIVLIGEHFQKGVFDELEKRELPLYTSDSYYYLLGGMIDLTKDLDYVVIENPLWGKRPRTTQAYKEFSERETKSNHWRIHDGVWDRPEYWNDFNLVFEHVPQAIPRSKNFSCSVLTLPAKVKMQKYYDKEINVLRNSVVCEDYEPNPKKEKELRMLLEEKDIVMHDEDIILCANRIVDRKLIEHLFPVVRNMEEITGRKQRLIATESIDEEKDYPQENVYQRISEYVAQKYNIPCSFGEVSKYIDGVNFTIPNLYRISKTSFLPSRLEGFGYGNVEPFMCGVPGSGRYGDVHPDFEQYGLDFKHYWNDEVLNLKTSMIKNFKYVEKILSDKNKYADFKRRMKLEWRLEHSGKIMKENEIAIIENLNHLKSAKELTKIMKLPGYQKLEKN